MAISTYLPQKANIQGFWKLDETSGTRYDETTNDNDLTDNATVLYAAGKIGNAADFEADNSEYLSIADAAQTGLDITGDISISCWIKPESLVNKWIFAKYDDSGVEKSYWCYITAANKINWQISDGTDVPLISSNNAVGTGTWYHIVCTFDASEQDMFVYLDTDVASNTSAGISAIKDSNQPFYIGKRFDGYYFDGLIDEVIVWNKCLTATEVLRVYKMRTAGGFFLFM